MQIELLNYLGEPLTGCSVFITFPPPAAGWSPVRTTDARGRVDLPCAAGVRGEVFVNGLAVYAGLLAEWTTFCLLGPEIDTRVAVAPAREATVIRPNRRETGCVA
ncbi:MAG: hypothetical protein AAFZ52_18420 [Bacteroidota bacterium]